MPAREYNFKGFKQIKINGAFDIEIKKEENFRIWIDADILKPVQVKQDGNTLGVSLPWYYYLWGFLTAFIRARVIISLPDLRILSLAGATRADIGSFTMVNDFSLEVAGASKISIDELHCGNAEVKLAGASQLTLKKIEAGDLRAELSGASRIEGTIILIAGANLRINGASRIELDGEANSLRLDCSGASNARLGELKVHNASVKLVGASRAVVNLDGRMDADVVGASDLSWIGNPVMGDIKSVGASQLHKA